jgi:predicted sulfurtransferase
LRRKGRCYVYPSRPAIRRQDEREEISMSETETVICLYPGCESPAVPPPKHGGPPPRYCEDETHNAHSTYKKLQEQEAEGSEADAS